MTIGYWHQMETTCWHGVCHMDSWVVSLLFSGSSAATAGILGLSGGSCCSSSRSSVGDTPVTETDLSRNFGPHQGRVPVPTDSVPQVSLWYSNLRRFRRYSWGNKSWSWKKALYTATIVLCFFWVAKQKRRLTTLIYPESWQKIQECATLCVSDRPFIALWQELNQRKKLCQNVCCFSCSCMHWQTCSNTDNANLSVSSDGLTQKK